MHAHARKAAPARRPDKTTARGWEGACTVRGSGSGTGSRCTAPALLATCKQKAAAAGGWRLVGPLLCCAGQCCAGAVQCNGTDQEQDRCCISTSPFRFNCSLSKCTQRESLRSCVRHPSRRRPPVSAAPPACLPRPPVSCPCAPPCSACCHPHARAATACVRTRGCLPRLGAGGMAWRAEPFSIWR